MNIQQFSERLIDLMKDKDLKIDDIARILDFHDSSKIYYWLKSKSMPSVKSIVKLANYFKCSIDYLLGRTEDDSIYTATRVKPFDEQLKIIMKEKGKRQVNLKNDRIASANNFHKWNKLKSTPQLDTVIKLADYFGVSVDYVLGRE